VQPLDPAQDFAHRRGLFSASEQGVLGGVTQRGALFDVQPERVVQIKDHVSRLRWVKQVVLNPGDGGGKRVKEGRSLAVGVQTLKSIPRGPVQ